MSDKTNAELIAESRTNAESLVPIYGGWLYTLTGFTYSDWLKYRECLALLPLLADRLEAAERENAELKVVKVAAETTPKQWSTAQAPTLEAIVATARQITTAQENKHLRQAISDAGFGILQAGGNLSLHCTTEATKKAEQVETRLVVENADLQRENERLRAELKQMTENRHLIADDLVALSEGRDVKTMLAETVRAKLAAACSQADARSAVIAVEQKAYYEAQTALAAERALADELAQACGVVLSRDNLSDDFLFDLNALLAKHTEMRRPTIVNTTLRSILSCQTPPIRPTNRP